MSYLGQLNTVLRRLNTLGWYQLQTADSYIEICNSSSAVDTPCRVIPGVDYWLINHSLPTTNLAHRRLFTANSAETEPTTPVAGFQRVDSRCAFSQGDPLSGFPVSCSVSCPSDTLLVGVVQCTALYTIGTFDDRLATTFQSNDNTVHCSVPYDDVVLRDFRPDGGESGYMEVGAMCASQ